MSLSGDGRNARIEHLLERYLDDGLASEEMIELEQTLLSSAAAREAFWNHAGFHALLRRLGQEH